ncbi:TonB-dependent receptor [Croceivirga lutea]|uniref:carboxypeptidase-like regulatory domain-containing protein n=1 Tax=Croceivirga lutea TaxID=1775167 RepID=UPI00163B51A6|nr:carboxypeptidase-like regulatory domain-containing protein [Croceivirga lutea]GGG37366.1 TonB-dependent receptor [Croceivirga lutea]
MRFVFFFLLAGVISAQEIVVSGKVISDQLQSPLTNVKVVVEGFNISSNTSSNGSFQLQVKPNSLFILIISTDGYVRKRIPIETAIDSLYLGIIALERDIKIEQTDNLITLTEADLSDDSETIENATGILQATRDIFLTRAAFDFGQAFFRVRGYDSQNGEVLLNGLKMNKIFDGRPQWNNWGGLNDVVRNQEFTNSLAPSNYTFGGILANTNINTRPSLLRSGTRLSASASNRTYAGRLMATYNSGENTNGLTYAVSGSRRWAEQGYVDGTLYDAFSVFGTVEYDINKKNTLLFTGILAKNRRGRSSAVTQEVNQLKGKQYNPYWGIQDGVIRNSRERDISEPIFMFNHFFTIKKLNITSGIAYQFGENARSRLGYYNAPNPDPTYYRYLPSFYINNPIGADFTNASLAREGFLSNSQLNWNLIYAANSATEENGKAAYVLYDDVVKSSNLQLSTVFNLNLNTIFKIDFGGRLSWNNLDNYAQIDDLLGASFHEDIDAFSNTLNAINGELRKQQGAIFNYNYEIEALNHEGFIQLQASLGKWNGFLATRIRQTQYQRNGLFQNERFLSNSLGKSDEINFSTTSVKAGFSYQFSGRHWLAFNSAFINRPPLVQNSFINPRENNLIVPNLQKEKISTLDASYSIRLPNLTGRITGFYTRFQNATDINFFFVDSGVGSDFVQEVITDMDKLHMGVEAGIEYQASSDVKLTLAANIGKYLYANNPSVSINFDTAGQEEPINLDGSIDLGIANIKDYKLAQGPQKALAIGVEYRNPKYWWIGVSANYMTNSYANISTITRTQSFLLNPETGEQFIQATPDNVAELLSQNPLEDIYLLNMVGGKSWLINGKYISAFLSINNLFDSTFRTGGYEQSRNGNFGQLQQDNLQNNPTFAPKYWYGFGRTYFLNLALSF